MKKSKRLILVRHGHRDKPHGSAFDNGISPRGKKQAARVKKFYRERFGDEMADLVSSPKLRCVETLIPLGGLLKKEVRSEALLSEEADGEKDEIEHRARLFLTKWLSSKKKLTVACSHGDWIPIFLREAVGVETELKKGAWAEITLVDGEPRLTWLMQSL